MDNGNKCVKLCSECGEIDPKKIKIENGLWKHMGLRNGLPCGGRIYTTTLSDALKHKVPVR